MLHLDFLPHFHIEVLLRTNFTSAREEYENGANKRTVGQTAVRTKTALTNRRFCHPPAVDMQNCKNLYSNLIGNAVIDTDCGHYKIISTNESAVLTAYLYILI